MVIGHEVGYVVEDFIKIICGYNAFTGVPEEIEQFFAFLPAFPRLLNGW